MNHSTCIVPDCQNFSQSKTKPGFCTAHYQRKYHGQDPFAVSVRQRASTKCVAPDCVELAPSGRLCANHYKAVRMGQLEVPGIRAFPFPPCPGPECDQIGTKSGLCPAHYAQRQRGVELKPVVFQRQLRCKAPDCDRTAKSQGLCTKHWVRLRDNGHFGVKWTDCDYETCSQPSKNKFCGEHTKLIVDEAIALAQATNCVMPDCNSKAGHWSRTLCGKHWSDMRSRGLEPLAYMKLMSIKTCEACGRTERLVTDHIHGHHERSEKMCPDCIRGRLCNGCNRALGYLDDDPDAIRGLLRYIESHAGKKPFGELFPVPSGAKASA